MKSSEETTQKKKDGISTLNEESGLSKPRLWFFRLIETSIDNSPRSSLLAYACYGYFYLHLLNIILSVPYPLNEVSSALKRVVLIATLDVHDTRYLGYHIFFGVYMCIVILLFILIQLPEGVLHFLSKPALRIWGLIYYINPWIIFPFTTNSFVVGIHCSDASNFLGQQGACDSVTRWVFLVYSIISLIFTLIMTFINLYASSTIVSRKWKLFSYSSWEHLFLIFYFFAVQIVMIFEYDSPNYGVIMGIMSLCGLLFATFLFYITMNFTHNVVMMIKILGYSINLTTSILVSLGQISSVKDFLETGATAKTLLCLMVLIIFITRALLNIFRKKLQEIISTSTKDLKHPLHVFHQYIIFSAYLKHGAKFENSDKVRKTREELMLRGLINMHLETCINSDCYCRSRGYLYDASVNQQGDESVSELYDRVFVKYLLRDILEAGLKKFPRSFTLGFAFAKCSMLKLGHMNRAYSTMMSLKRDQNSMFEAFYIFYGQKQLRLITKLTKQNDTSPLGLVDSKFLEFEPFYADFTAKMKRYTELSLLFVDNIDRQEVALIELQTIGLQTVQVYHEIEKMWDEFIREYSESFRRPYLMYGLFLFLVANQPYSGSKLLEYYQKKYFDSRDGREKHTNFDTFDNMNANFFICIDGSKRRLGHILYTSHNAEDFTGYARELLLRSNVSTLMTKFFAVHHNSFLLSHIDKGTQNILLQSRELLLQRKDGFIFPILQRTSFYIDPKHGISYMAMLTKSQNPYEYILVTHEGFIDSFTEKVGKLLNLNKNVENDAKPIAKLQFLCEEFDSVNRARNVELLFEKNWKIQGRLNVVNDSRCQRYFDESGNVVAEYREEINKYLQLSNDIKDGFILRIKPFEEANKQRKSFNGTDRDDLPTYTVYCHFEEQFFMENTTFIRSIAIESITREGTKVIETGAKRSVSVYDPVKKAFRADTTSDTHSMTQSIPEDIVGASLNKAIDNLKFRVGERNFTSMKSAFSLASLPVGRTLSLQSNILGGLDHSFTKRSEISYTKRSETDHEIEIMQNPYPQEQTEEEGNDKTYQTISNFGNNFTDNQSDRQPDASGHRPLAFGLEKRARLSSQSFLAAGLPSTNRKLVENDKEYGTQKISLKKADLSNLFNADVPSRYLERSMNNNSTGNMKKIVEKESTGANVQVSKESKLLTKKDGQAIQQVLKQIINQNYYDQKLIEGQKSSIGSSTTSSGIRSFAKQVELLLKSTNYSSIIKRFQLFALVFFLALIGFWLAVEEIASTSLTAVAADQVVIKDSYERLEALVEITRLATYVLLEEQGIFEHTRLAGPFQHNSDYESFNLEQLQIAQSTLRTLNDNLRGDLTHISEELAKSVYDDFVPFTIYGDGTSDTLTLQSLQATSYVSSFAHDLSTLAKNHFDENNPVLKTILINSMDKLTVDAEEMPSKFIAQIDYSLDEDLAVLIIFAILSIVLTIISILIFAYVIRRLYIKKVAFFNLFCAVTPEELIYMKSEILAFQQIVSMAYLEEATLIEYRAKSQGALHNKAVGKLRQETKKTSAMIQNRGNHKFLKRGSTRHLSRRVYLRFIPLFYLFVIATVIYSAVLIQFKRFQTTEKELILSQYIGVEDRLHLHSLAMAGIYLLVSYNGQFSLRMNDITTELATILDKLYSYDEFLSSFNGESVESEEWSNIVHGNYCLNVSATLKDECETVGSGACTRGITGMDTFMNQVHTRILQTWLDSDGSMSRQQLKELLVQDGVEDSELMYTRYFYPAYIHFIEVMQSSITEATHEEAGLITTFSVLFYILSTIGILSVFALLNVLRKEDIELRKILRQIPIQIIITNATLKKALKKNFLDMRLLI